MRPDYAQILSVQFRRRAVVDVPAQLQESPFPRHFPLPGKECPEKVVTQFFSWPSLGPWSN